MAFQIDLGGGRFALVDDDDRWLVEWRHWTIKRCRTNYYAISGGVFLHHVIIGRPKGAFVDHKNGDGLDNRKGNLRFCTQAQNSANSRKRQGKTTSRFKGVHRDGGRWVAAIRQNGITLKLGSFRDEVAAALQYDRAARLMFGRFAKTNRTLGLLDGTEAVQPRRLVAVRRVNVGAKQTTRSLVTGAIA